MKFCLFNVENFFLTHDKRMPFHQSLKEPEKAQWIGRTLMDIDADIVMLTEVGGLESLKILNESYLESLYTPSLIEGNSDRGIDVGFLVSSFKNLSFEHYTHKDKELEFNYPHELNLDLFDSPPVHKMSRDVAELHVFQNNDNEKKLLFIILLVHLKSAHDPDGIDFKGALRREAEVKLLTKIYNEIKEKNSNTPIFVCGDFNGAAKKESYTVEFNSLYENTDLVDIGDALNWNEKERSTFLYFDREKGEEHIQLDYFFLPPNLIDCIDSQETYVYRFKDNLGKPHPTPKNVYERYQLPSDHYPLVVTLKNI